MEGERGGGGGGGASLSRRSLSMSGSLGRRKNSDSSLALEVAKRNLTCERTVRRLRLSKALTMPENTMVLEACQRMAARRVDAALLTDSNALLCGILTDKDIATRVIARELNIEETPVSKVMTRNPIFVLSDTLAVEALQKMVQGKFRHLPVVENGEVIAILDIAKCLYDAIARLERAAEKGRAIAAAVEGVEKQWGTTSGPNSFIDALREKMFRPSISTIIEENPKVVTVSPDDSVLAATKKMLELRLSSAVVTAGNKPIGILTSRDILMRVVAQGLFPECVPIEEVMTGNPGCGSVDTPIVDALHTMHDGKFLHLPVVDRDGNIAGVVDVIRIAHAAITTIGNSWGAGNEAANSMMQSIWDSALELAPLEEEDEGRSETSLKLPSEGADTGKSSPYPYSAIPNTFGFKIQDRRGRMHRFNSDIRSLSELTTCILQRVGPDLDKNYLPQILYEDEDCDKVILASDGDLQAAVEHAMSAGLKGLKLHLDYSGSSGGRRNDGSAHLEFGGDDVWPGAYGTVAAGAALVAGLGFMAYLKKSSS